MNLRPFVAFDLETAPTERALNRLPDEDWLNRGIRENFRPETIQQYRERNAAEWAAECTRRGALDWRLGEIVAAGTARPRIVDEQKLIEAVIVLNVGDEFDAPTRDWRWDSLLDDDLPRDGSVAVLVRVAPNEAQLLQRLWLSMPSTAEQLAGFNLRSFDLPWILGRSAVHRIRPPRAFNPNRYHLHDVVDWADVLTAFGAFPRDGWTLAQYAEWFDLRFRPWSDGADVVQWRADRDFRSIGRHLLFDLLTTYALHERFALAYLS